VCEQGISPDSVRRSGPDYHGGRCCHERVGPCLSPATLQAPLSPLVITVVVGVEIAFADELEEQPKQDFSA